MLTLLADLPAPDAPQSVGWFMIVLVGIIMGLYYSVALWKMLAGHGDKAKSPQPFIVQAHEEFAPLAAHIELKNRVDKIADDIRQGFERLDQKRSVSIAGLHEDLQTSSAGLRSELKEDITGVHNRINEVLEAVAELKGRFMEGFRK